MIEFLRDNWEAFALVGGTAIIGGAAGGALVYALLRAAGV